MKLLVGHIPIELSRLMAGFPAASITNSLIVKPCGKRRRREIGLIIPGSYYARSKSKKFMTVLYNELSRVKQIYQHFDIVIESVSRYIYI